MEMKGRLKDAAAVIPSDVSSGNAHVQAASDNAVSHLLTPVKLDVQCDGQ